MKKSVKKVIIIISVILALILLATGTIWYFADEITYLFSVHTIQYEEFDFETETPIQKAEIILQNPQLPTGCEATAASMLLNCYNIKIDKRIVADKIPKFEVEEIDGKVYAPHPNEYFIGDPRQSSSFGVFAAPVTATINEIFDEIGADLTARDITGASQQEILKYIDSGHPVCIWATMSLVPVQHLVGWNLIADGKYTDEFFTWPAHEHCLLLIGYDESTVTVLDPLKSEVKYDRELFFTRHTEVGGYAVVVQKN